MKRLESASQALRSEGDPRRYTSQAFKRFKQEQADSWSNQLAIGTENMLASINTGLSVFSNMVGLEDLGKDFAQSAKDFEKSAAERPTPSRTPVFSEEYERITEKFSDGEILEGMAEIATQAKTFMATALPFIAPAVGTVAAVRMASPFVSAIPVVGVPANIILQTVGTILPGFVMGGGTIHKEAKSKGATDEAANAAAVGGGVLVGILDRFVGSVVVNQFLKVFGKQKVRNIIADQVGEEAADETIKKAAKIGTLTYLKEATKGGLKIGFTEAGTEAVQDAVIAKSAAIASNTEVTNLGKRMIDGAVLGFFGGMPVGTVIGGMQPMLRKEAIRRAEEFKESDQKLGRGVQDASKELELLEYKDIDRKSFAPEATKGLRRALSFVAEGLGKTALGRQLLNAMGNFYNNTYVEAGNILRRIENEVVQGVLKDTKLPFSKRVKKQISIAVGRRL